MLSDSTLERPIMNARGHFLPLGSAPYYLLTQPARCRMTLLGIVGTSIALDGTPHIVIGAMPPGFYLYGNSELAWAPLQLQTQDAAASSRTVHSIWGLARLEPGQGVKNEQAQVDSVAWRLHREDAQGDAGFGVILQSYQDALTDSIRQPLWLLMGCVGFVLLIACSNVANLLLARAGARRMEKPTFDFAFPAFLCAALRLCGEGFGFA